MFSSILMFFAWLPSPIDLLVKTVLMCLIIWGLVKLIGALWDLLPFT